MPDTTDRPLSGHVALVAGGTRGAGRGMAVELGAAGATVYVTGRSTRGSAGPSGRPETIEETAELVTAAGGHGVPVRCDHTVQADVAALARRIETERGGRLDILVDDVPAGDAWIEWKPFCEHDLAGGLRAVHDGLSAHLITLHTLLPLMTARGSGLVCEITDGDEMFNARYRGSMFFDVVKVAIARLGRTLAAELTGTGITSLSLTPGYLRSEAMLAGRGVTEDTWRDAIADDRWFAIAESPRYIGRAVVALATDPEVARWNGRSLSVGALARHYGFTDVDGSAPDAIGYLADAYFGDHQDADVTQYR